MPLVGVAAANARLVEAFATDEAMQLNLLRAAAAKHSFALTFGPYGHLVFNLILVVLRMLPGEPSDARIIYTGRTISVLFAAAALWLTFVWARRVFGVTAAWIAFGFLFVNATFYTWAVVLKPDMPQLFFLMLALALTCRLADEPRDRVVALASGAAGLAFACKYSGLFVLPIIAAVIAWRPPPAGRVAARVAVLRGLTLAKAAALFAVSLILNAAWIASHLTEDGRIDAALSPGAVAGLAILARGGALVLTLLAIMPWCWTALRRRPRLVATLWSWTVAAAGFAAAFIVTSPYSLRRAAFVKGLFVEASDAAAPLSAAWVSTWLHGIVSGAGWPMLMTALATLAGLAWWLIRDRARLAPAEGIVAGWIVVYALVLSAPVHEFYVHYVLPLIPPLAMLAGRGAVAAAQWLGGVSARPRAADACVLVLAGTLIGISAPGLVATRAQLQDREHLSEAIWLGKWLECRAPGSARVAYDYFSYVPPAFKDARPTWGGTRAWLSDVDPDIVIVNGVTAATATEDAGHASYYQCLADASCGYQRVASRGALTLYARDNQASGMRTRPDCSPSH